MALRHFHRPFPRRIAVNPLQEELGFGRTVTTAGRMMNQDGSFNVERQKAGVWDNTYYHLMTMSWARFFLLVLCCYILMNLLFAALYCCVGVDELLGMHPGSLWDNYLTSFFFSTQTLTTVGYGAISPHGVFANLLASLESFCGLLAFALISGLLYGRFSRPQAKIVFSENILVSPYRNQQGLMFRMSNARRSEMIETEVKVLLAINQRDESDNVTRRFFALKLEIDRISFFTMSWTVVHALDEDSPLNGFTKEELVEANAEVLVLVKGTDEANQQLVHTRCSYTAEEIVWNARFKPVLGRNPRGQVQVLTQIIGSYELLES